MSSPVAPTHVLLVHESTKEERLFPIDAIRESAVIIFWPLAGSYELDLGKNVLRAMSSKAREKGTAAAWRAADIVALRAELSAWRRALKVQQEEDGMCPALRTEREASASLRRRANGE